MKAKTKTNCVLTIAAALVAGSSLDASAQTWQTVLDYQYVPGYAAA